MSAGKGFTLLELLLVIAIMSILTVIAYPAYTAHLIKTHRAQAKANLLQLAGCLENYYTVHHHYKNATMAWCNFSPADKHYQYEITAEIETYQLTAIPQGSQNHDNCGILTYTQTGLKGAANIENKDNCW